MPFLWVASLEKQRETNEETVELVIYVQIGSGFMLLCNLLLKCPIINHTFWSSNYICSTTLVASTIPRDPFRKILRK